MVTVPSGIGFVKLLKSSVLHKHFSVLNTQTFNVSTTVYLMPRLRNILRQRKSHYFLYSDRKTKAMVEGKRITQEITSNTMDLTLK